MSSSSTTTTFNNNEEEDMWPSIVDTLMDSGPIGLQMTVDNSDTESMNGDMNNDMNEITVTTEVEPSNVTTDSNTPIHAKKKIQV